MKYVHSSQTRWNHSPKIQSPLSSAGSFPKLSLGNHVRGVWRPLFPRCLILDSVRCLSTNGCFRTPTEHPLSRLNLTSLLRRFNPPGSFRPRYLRGSLRVPLQPPSGICVVPVLVSIAINQFIFCPPGAKCAPHRAPGTHARRGSPRAGRTQAGVARSARLS